MLTYANANAHKGSAHTVIVYTESRLYPKTKNKKKYIKNPLLQLRVRPASVFKIIIREVTGRKTPSYLLNREVKYKAGR